MSKEQTPITAEQFKKGDKVFVSDNGTDWNEQTFLYSFEKLTFEGEKRIEYVTYNIDGGISRYCYCKQSKTKV